ncbi:MAG: hypothetical protein QOJ53_1711 [Sphingomonadales bacterium]|jgi:hypothetical protein|nr:hypothetical protein [Sphingomonadales bacterium]MEA3047379.1 hypothetical protein [Sphingomonadales bacterium]
MRIILAGAVGAAFALLAGCGAGSAYDNSLRDQFKQSAVEGCTNAARRVPGAERIDAPRLCGCTIERYMATKTTEQLRNADPHDPALVAAREQCLMEQIGGAAPAAGGGEANEAGGEEEGATP